MNGELKEKGLVLVFRLLRRSILLYPIHYPSMDFLTLQMLRILEVESKPHKHPKPIKSKPSRPSPHLTPSTASDQPQLLHPHNDNPPPPTRAHKGCIRIMRSNRSSDALISHSRPGHPPARTSSNVELRSHPATHPVARGVP